MKGDINIYDLSTEFNKFYRAEVVLPTTVQNDNNDYDIDVAIVFEKSRLGD